MRTVISLIFLFFAQNVLAQTTDWQTLTTDDYEFSVQMPANCYSYLYVKDGITVHENGDATNLYQLKDMQLLTCYHDKTLFSVEIFSADNKKAAVKALAHSSGERGGKNELKLDKNFHGREYIVNEQNYSRNSRYISSKKRIYAITTASRDQSDSLMKRFLDSVKLNASSNIPDEQKNLVFISKLKSVEPEISFEQKSGFPKPNPSANPIKQVDESGVRKLVLLLLPKAQYTEAARQAYTVGVVRLRLTFGINGNIDKIAVHEPLGDGLLRTAAMSALRTRFLPEERDDQPVSVSKWVEYGFNIY